jgi:hypothetical protein
MAMQPNGSFLLAWLVTADGAGPIAAQLLDRDGDRLVDPFQVGASSLYPAVATATASGGFAFAWDQGRCTGGSQPCRIQARFFDRGGRPLGPEMTVAAPDSSTLLPAIAADSGGNVAISWQDCGESFSSSCPIGTSVYTTRGTPYLAFRSVPADYQALGPALAATPYGFLLAGETYAPSPAPWGIAGWQLALP